MYAHAHCLCIMLVARYQNANSLSREETCTHCKKDLTSHISPIVDEYFLIYAHMFLHIL